MLYICQDRYINMVPAQTCFSKVDRFLTYFHHFLLLFYGASDTRIGYTGLGNVALLSWLTLCHSRYM